MKVQSTNKEVKNKETVRGAAVAAGSGAIDDPHLPESNGNATGVTTGTGNKENQPK